MEIKQKTYLEVVQGEYVVQLVVDPKMPLGSIFDALMELKGYVCDRMIKAHQDEAAEAERMMAPTEVEQETPSEV